MRKPRIYLETTMLNYYFEVEREAHPATRQLFECIRRGMYEAYTSTYVIDELIKAPAEKATKMMALIETYRINMLANNNEAETLAEIYVQKNVIPQRFRYDGLHIACATVNDLEFIFSLNFKHINKPKTQIMTGTINIERGYRPVTITSPMEVTDYE